MAIRGECIDNPVTHQRIVYTETAADTGGALYQMKFNMLKGAFIVGGEHIHPAQSETFQCLKGTLRFIIDGKEEDLHQGDETTVPAGSTHDWWNPSKTEGAMALVTFRPALRYEEYFETIFGLARDGKVRPSGFPRALQAAAIFHGFRESVRPPKAWQRAGLAIILPPIATVANLLGYRSTYPKYKDHSSCTNIDEDA